MNRRRPQCVGPGLSPPGRRRCARLGLLVAAIGLSVAVRAEAGPEDIPSGLPVGLPVPAEAPVFVPGFGGARFAGHRAPTNAFADLAPFSPEELDFVELLKIRPLSRVTMRPTGVPWFLPGELSTTRTGARPGPGVGLDLSWTPQTNWRFGADLIWRADRMDANNQLHDWTPYLAPGVEYIPYPHAPRPFSIGLVAPLALRDHGERWSGYFVVIRWEEILRHAARGRR